MKALGQAWMALSVLMMTSFAQAEGNDVVPSVGNAEQTMTEQMSGNKGGHLSIGSRIGDILNNPAFAGFGSLILARDNRNYDESTLLSDIGSLLPYHSHVDPEVVVSALNHMIDDVNSGKTVFYDFYTEAQKRAEPTREHTPQSSLLRPQELPAARPRAHRIAPDQPSLAIPWSPTCRASGPVVRSARSAQTWGRPRPCLRRDGERGHRDHDRLLGGRFAPMRANHREHEHKRDQPHCDRNRREPEAVPPSHRITGGCVRSGGRRTTRGHPPQARPQCSAA
jgi:hypothetical protein